MDGKSEARAPGAEPLDHNDSHLEGVELAIEPEKRFNLLSICSLGIVTGNTWAALGGSVTVSLYNGGLPGIIYEFIVVSIFYWLIAASIAELASAMPTSSGVYHWASVTAGPRHGRFVAWLAGWWNFFAWLFAAASLSSIIGNQTIQMYALFRPDYIPLQWHVFVSYFITTWLCCSIVLFWNRGLPGINDLGLFLIVAGVLITIIVCAVMPGLSGGGGYATNAAVWTDWSNETGYTSEGFVFCMGMLNGAFAVGTPDCVTHVAEEIPNPRVNVPKAIAAQCVIGFVTTLCFLLAIFYAITNLDDVRSGGSYPLAKIYWQATGTSAGALGLLIVVFLPTFCTCIGCYITAGRMLWTLGRADVTPFSGWIGILHPAYRNPFNATLICGIACSCLGSIYIGSTTAFNAFVGSFVILGSLSYTAAVLPHLLRGRSKLEAGPFFMKGYLGYLVNTLSCGYMIVFVVIYSFPYSAEFDATNMNYTSLITGGLTIFVVLWWFWKNHFGKSLHLIKPTPTEAIRPMELVETR